MHSLGSVVSLAVVMLLGLLAPSAQPGAIAQEATPAADEMEMMGAGMTFEPLALAAAAELTSPADISVIRVTLEPGAGFPVESSDPSTGILLVESGAITIEVSGAVTVTRGAGLRDAVATAEAGGDYVMPAEEMAAGEVVTLEAGDSALVPGNIEGSIRNDGAEPAVALGFLISPSGMMTGDMATPQP